MVGTGRVTGAECAEAVERTTGAGDTVAAEHTADADCPASPERTARGGCSEDANGWGGVKRPECMEGTACAEGATGAGGTASEWVNAGAGGFVDKEGIAGESGTETSILGGRTASKVTGWRASSGRHLDT